MISNMLSSNSALLLLHPMVSGFRGRKNTACLTEPRRCKKWGVPNNPVSANSWHRVLGEGIREIGQAPRDPCHCPAAWWGAPLLPGELLGRRRSAFRVRCPSPTSLSSADAAPYPGAFRASGNVPLCFPLDGQHRGRRQKLTPFFGLNSSRFSSEEVGAFRRAKRLFLESTRSQSHLIDFLHRWGGKSFIHFICFIPWGSSPKPEVASGKARGILTVLILQIVKWTHFPPLLVNVFHYAFNEIVLTYLWSNKIRKKIPWKSSFQELKCFNNGFVNNLEFF